MNNSQLSIKAISVSIVGLIMAVITFIFIWKYVNDDKGNKVGSLKTDGDTSAIGQTGTNLPVVTPTPPVIPERVTSPLVTPPASEQDSKEVVFTLKDGYGKHFEEFKTIFNDVFKDNPNYIYSNNNNLKNKLKKRYNNIKGGLLPLLQAMAYRDIFIFTPYVHFGGANLKQVIDRLSKDSEIRKFNVIKANKEESEAMFKKILTHPTVVNNICISHENIQNIKTINLRYFTFDALPKVFSVFESLQSVYLNKTGIRDLEPLNEAKNLTTITANRNEITTVEGLEDLTKLKFLDLSYNNITKIDKDFLTNHTKIGYRGILLCPKAGFEFSKEVKDAIEASNDKIKIF